MCQRLLPREAIEASEPTDYELECDQTGLIPTDEELCDAFSDFETDESPDICPTWGMQCTGCHNCR